MGVRGHPDSQRAHNNMLDDLAKMDINTIADMKRLFERDSSANAQNILFLDRLLLEFPPAENVSPMDITQLARRTGVFMRATQVPTPPGSCDDDAAGTLSDAGTVAALEQLITFNPD